MLHRGRRVIGISGSLIWSKTLMELYLTPVEKFGEVWRAQLAKSTLLTTTLVSLDLFRSVQMLKRGYGADSKGKLPHLFIPSKTATLFPEFAVEDLPLGRTTVLVPGFAVNDLTLGRTL